VIGQNGGALFVRLKPTTGCSANGRRRRINRRQVYNNETRTELFQVLCLLRSALYVTGRQVPTGLKNMLRRQVTRLTLLM
jgi:hypothetical protein